MSQSRTSEQQDGINNRKRNILLEAGAGTGKTTVLVARYCDRLAGESLAPDQILAFTFTEKAAKQLRQRIKAELRRRAAASDDVDVCEHLEKAVENFGGSWISTFHGFCRRLLATHPVAAGLDPSFRVFDQAETERVAREAFTAALEEFSAAEDVQRDLIVAAYRADGLRAMVRGAFDQMRSEGVEEPRLPEVTPSDVPDAMAALIRAAEAVPAAGRLSDERTELIERAIELARGYPEKVPEIDQLTTTMFASTAKAIKEAVNEFCKAVMSAAAALAENGEGEEIHAHIAELVELYGKHFREAKENRSGLDFDDLQLLAISLLERSEAIRNRYQSRLVEIMVDEFQDTNRVQLELVRLLQGPETSVFSVGDEFQSIYGFRNADVKVFREQREELKADPNGSAVLPLSGNFRSHPDVIAAANHLAGPMLSSFRELTVGADRADARGADDTLVELLVSDTKAWPKEGDHIPPGSSVSHAKVVEARFLAQRLRELVDSGGAQAGEIVVLVRGYSGIEAYEIALEDAGLRPFVIGGSGYWSHQQAGDLLAILATIANPLDDEPLLGALASPACAASPDALLLLRRAAGHTRHTWPTLDRFCRGIEPGEDAAPWVSEIPDLDAERLTRFHAVVTELRRIGTRLGLEQMIERAITDTGYDLSVLMRPPGTSRMANIRKLLRLARAYEATEGRDLRGFLEYAEFGVEIDSEAVATTEAEGHDGVRVMTIHRAKGLEFPVVAVPGLARSLLGGSRSKPDLTVRRDREGRWHTGMVLKRVGGVSVPIYENDGLAEIGKELDSEEELRLFYVAATRAERRLILSSAQPSSKSMEATTTNTPVISRILGDLGFGNAPDDGLVPIGSPQPRPGLSAAFPGYSMLIANNPGPEEEGTGATDQLEHAVASPASAPSVSSPLVELPSLEVPPPITAAPTPPSQLPVLSYSALGEYEKCGYRFYVEKVLKLRLRPDAVGSEISDGAASRVERFGFGSAVHLLLEWSARHDWVIPNAEMAGDALKAEELDPEPGLVAETVESVRAWIDSPLCAELQAERGRVRVEVPLLLDIGGSVLRGSIDLLHEPESGIPTVVDYKTSHLGESSPVEKSALYETQRRLYALATANATGAETVRVAYVFLERPSEPVVTLFGAAEIEASRVDLEAQIGRVQGGDFTPTSNPEWPLCHDCPARRRLCPGPAAAPAG